MPKLAPRRRKRFVLRTIAAVSASVLVLALLAVGVFVATFDANTYKPRLQAAVEQATGRQLTLAGPIGLKFALHPTIEARGVALGNPPGFSRPDLVTFQAIDLKLALLPLLRRRVEIDRITLVHPDILLERNGAGVANWSFEQPLPPEASKNAASATTSPTTPAATQPRRVPSVSIGQVEVIDGILRWHAQPNSEPVSIAVSHLVATGGGAGRGPLHVTAQGSLNGAPIALEANGASLAALLAANSPSPVKLTLAGAGARLVAEGLLGGAAEGGFQASVDATIPSVAALGSYFPHLSLPPLRNAALHARVARDAAGKLDMSDASVTIGPSDLGQLYPGLQLTRFEAIAPSMEQPLRTTGEANLNGVPVTLAGQFGGLASLLSQPPGKPVPFEISVQTKGANISLRGAVADPHRLAGVNGTIEAQAVDLSALSPLAAQPLPALHQLSLTGHLALSLGPGGTLALSGLRLTSAQGDAGGDLAMAPGPPVALHASLHSEHIDASAFSAAFAASEVRPEPQAPVAPGTPGSAPPARHVTNRVFSDAPIGFEKLRTVNADVAWTIGELKLERETWLGIAARLALKSGKLALPVSAQVPGGPLAASVVVDAAASPVPTFAFSLRAPSVPLQSLLAAAGQPGYAKGSVATVADLHAGGASAHAMAASLEGTLALTMNGGEIENRVLQQALGPVIARADPLGILGKGNTSDIHCFALRLVSHNGHAELTPLLLSSSLITLDGSGRVDLGAEQLNLLLRPEGRIGGRVVSVPVRVAGGLRDPRISVDNAQAAQSGVAAVVGALTGKPIPGLAEPEAPSCATALALARGVQPPPPAPVAPSIKAPLPAKPAELLRQLLH